MVLLLLPKDIVMRKFPTSEDCDEKSKWLCWALQRSVGTVGLCATLGASDEESDSMVPDDTLKLLEKALTDDDQVKIESVMESWQLSGHEARAGPCQHFEQGDAKGTTATVARNELDSMTLESGGDLSHHMANTFEQFSCLKMAGESMDR